MGRFQETPQDKKKLRFGGSVDPQYGSAPQSTSGMMPPIRGAATGFAQGYTGNFGDEAIAAPMMAIGGGSYSDALDSARAFVKKSEADAPASYTGGMIAGSILGPGKAVNALSKAPKLAEKLAGVPRYLGYGAEGGLVGSIEAAGLAEGDAMDRADDTGMGALVGAGAGMALPAIAEGAFRVGRSAIQPIIDRFGAMALTGAGREIEKAARISGWSPATIMKRLSARGPEAMLADVSPAFKALAENVAQGSVRGNSVASTALNSRARGQGDRLTKMVKTNVADTGYFDMIDEMGTKRAKEASPFYDKAFDNTKPVSSDAIDRLMTRPSFKQGMAKGVRIMRNEEAATGLTPHLSDAMFDGFEDGAGDLNLLFKQVPSLRVLDAAKRGLDDMIYGPDFRNQYGKLTTEGRSLEMMRKTLVDELDRMTTVDGVSNYAIARAKWSGPTRIMEAGDKGRDMIFGDPEEMARTIAKYTDDELEGFRAGAAKAIIDRINHKDFNADAAKSIFNNRAMQKSMRLIAPHPDDYKEMIKGIANEMNMSSTRRQVAGGSPTAFRTAMRKDTDTPEAPQIVGNAMMGNFGAALTGAGRALYRRVTDGPSQPVLDQLAPMLFSTDRAVQKQAMDLLAERYPVALKMHQRGMAALSTMGRTGGAVGGSIPMLPQENQEP